MSGSWMNANWWGPSPVQYLGPNESFFPEDVEAGDVEVIQNRIETYFNKTYPPFEPEVISTPEKDYFLPALKVLVKVEDNYISPGYEAVWKDMELRAVCRQEDESRSVVVKGKIVNGRMYIEEEHHIVPPRHEAPDSSCDCGIYGSVHLEELKRYLVQKTKFESPQFSLSVEDVYDMEYMLSNRPPRNRPANKLCIIEPAPDAKVILCRKGWKASHAFISEIVEETISINVASNLLSIAWHRPVDVARLYEDR